MESTTDPSFRGQTKTNAAATKPVEANPRFSGRGGAIRGVAVRERGGVSRPDHRGGARSDIDSTCSGRGRVTHDPVPIRPVAIPNLAHCSRYQYFIIFI